MLTAQGSEGKKKKQTRSEEKNQDRGTAVRKTYTLKITVIVSSSKGQITKRSSNLVYGKQVNKIRKDALTDTHHQPDFFYEHQVLEKR